MTGKEENKAKENHQNQKLSWELIYHGHKKAGRSLISEKATFKQVSFALQ